jgi:glucose/arabinose dehydrogenase
MVRVTIALLALLALATLAGCVPRPLQTNAQAPADQGRNPALPTAAVRASETPTSAPAVTPTSAPTGGVAIAALPETFTLPATLPAYRAPFGGVVGALDQGRPLHLHRIWVEVSGESWNGAGATGLVWINLADLPSRPQRQP